MDAAGRRRSVPPSRRCRGRPSAATIGTSPRTLTTTRRPPASRVPTFPGPSRSGLRRGRQRIGRQGRDDRRAGRSGAWCFRSAGRDVGPAPTAMMIGAVGTWAPGRRWARRRSRTPRQTGTPSPTAPLTPAGRRGPTSRGGRRVPGRCLGAPGCYRAPTVGASLRTTALSPTRCSGGPGSRDLLSSRVRCSRRGVGPGAVRDASRPPPSARAHRSSPASHLTRLGRRLRVEGRGLPSPAQTSREGRPPGALREATRDPPWLETATQNAGPPFEAPQDI